LNTPGNKSASIDKDPIVEIEEVSIIAKSITTIHSEIEE
jgi:hypothetical protein